MIHPLFKLMAAHPTVLTDHVEAYASLAAQELGTAATQWRSRALKTGIAMCCAASAAVLAGVALMLWASTAPIDLHAPWALWVAPGLPALAAVACWWSAQNAPAQGAFAILRGQLSEDMALLREVNA
ncbi:MAG: hypothetical protein K2Y02_08120 [Burkholderiaceae bacterium]|nr:hypothetical protein [Burkholderiaceae bacterium]